jgi:hypothetical protein
LGYFGGEKRECEPDSDGYHNQIQECPHMPIHTCDNVCLCVFFKEKREEFRRLYIKSLDKIVKDYIN